MSAASEPARILIVEDDKSLGATLHERLIKEGFAVTWVTSIKEALDENGRGHFDLYILDVGLPDGEGFDLAPLLSGPKLFLTAQADAEARLRGYELGAEEFIPKPFHLRELLLRVRHVLENHRPSRVLEVNGLRIDFEGFTFSRNGVVEAVPVKDLRLLHLLVERSPRVVSRDEALNLLWGEDKYPSARSVDNTILRLRTLLGEQLSNSIESVRGIGYRWTMEKRT